MAFLKFNPNEKIALGVEVEVQLINPETGNLHGAGPDILKYLKDNSIESRIKSEIFQSMLEIDTPICQDAFDVGISLRSSLETLKDVARKFNAEVMMSGTHPFALYTDRQLTAASRYFDLVDRNQWITRRLQIFGLHVHLGMRDGEHAIAMNNALCHYLPMILGMSASSPYWSGQDTGLASSRITIFEATPTGGHPILLENWKHFEELIEKLVKSRSIRSLKDLWWDIRPNIEFGTIEIRIADCPPTVREIEALVAVIHTLTLFIDEELKKGKKYSPPPEWILRENKWRASRHGIEADLIYSPEGDVMPLKQLWAQLRDSMKPVWDKLEYQEFIQFADQILDKGPSYLRQRKHGQDMDLNLVVRHLIRECDQDTPEW